MVIRSIFIFMLCLGVMGCTVKEIGYTALGTAAGAGVGYSYHKDSKEAVIGGAVGGTAGAIVAAVQEKTEKSKYKAGFEEGYSQAQVDIAVQNWNDNTGKCAHERKEVYKHLTRFKVPEKEQDNVLYESHYITLEDYR